MSDELVLRLDGTAPLSRDAVHAVEEVVARAETLDGVVTVELSGAPAGSWIADVDVSLVSKWERALRRLERLDAAKVALASGDLGGIALDVLLTTDYRVAAPGTRLLVSAESGATWPGMAAYRLAQQAGVAPVRGAVLFGHPIDATAALALGLVHEVTDTPATAARSAAASIAPLSGKELAIRRRLLQDAATTSFEEALGAHLAACDRLLRQIAPTGAPR